MNERTPQRAYLDLQKLARDQGRNTQIDGMQGRGASFWLPAERRWE